MSRGSSTLASLSKRVYTVVMCRMCNMLLIVHSIHDTIYSYKLNTE